MTAGGDFDRARPMGMSSDQVERSGESAVSCRCVMRIVAIGKRNDDEVYRRLRWGFRVRSL